MLGLDQDHFATDLRSKITYTYWCNTTVQCICCQIQLKAWKSLKQFKAI